jgi:uncharacterized protein (TIGR03067 family)
MSSFRPASWRFGARGGQTAAAQAVWQGILARAAFRPTLLLPLHPGSHVLFPANCSDDSGTYSDRDREEKDHLADKRETAQVERRPAGFLPLRRPPKPSLAKRWQGRLHQVLARNLHLLDNEDDSMWIPRKGTAMHILLAFAAVALQPGQDIGQELKLLEGTWRVGSMEETGQAARASKTPEKLVISGNKLTGIGPEMIIKLNPNKRPKWIDMTFEKGSKKYPIRAIYEISGAELKLCMPLAQKGKLFKNERPASFDTSGKEELFAVIYVLKREQS